MSTERWNTDRLFTVTGDSQFDISQWARLFNPDRIEIEDTGAEDAVYTVRHLLGRIPQKVIIARQEVAGTDPVAWYRNPTDDAWTETEVTLRFNVANARVLLEIS